MTEPNPTRELMLSHWRWLAAALLLLSVPFLPMTSTAQLDGQPELPRILININTAVLDVEIANSSRQRYNGLSLRESLAENAAMLFVYRAEGVRVFTMRDTSIPLSIAFIDDNLTINEIFDMEPFEDGPYPASFPSMYALEVRQGWFQRAGVSVGDKLIPKVSIPTAR